MNMRIKLIFASAITLSVFICTPINAQLIIGTASTGVNFREGPGKEFKIIYAIDTSNLLVVLPREPKNNFIEVFDVETSSRGYVAESLIRITDTLNFGQQHFFEKSGENATGDIEIELINGTNLTLFVWINKFSYDIAPHEKKILIPEDEEVIYFSSAPGMFPVFGREILQKGNTYIWKFSK
jgi:hypothetical protein